jgi:superfamily I DNA/RNA helicase
MKANEKTVDGLMKELEPDASKPLTSADTLDIRSKVILSDIIKPFYEEYEKTLHQSYQIDFTDAIIQATELCRKDLWRHYEYILVDEFQDISIDRYKFLQALRSSSANTKLFCVGDDWQSIFRFAGSDMSLVYDFEKYFGYTELCKIETTYRFHQPLIDKSSEFIMKNNEQKEKTIKTPDGDTKKTYLNFVKCFCEEDDAVKKKVEEIVKELPLSDSILLLGRYNYDAISVGYIGEVDKKDNRMKVKIADREIPFLSVHSAKGLEADHVILVNCNQGAYGFPSLIEDDPILDFVLSKSEAYPFAEERRLFYVAMTRARKRMYILYDRKRPSPFIGEFLVRVEKGSYLCPKCLEGKIESIKDGETSNGEKFRSFVCSNHEGGCDFFETKYGDLTPPGILITEEMTAQDIEKLREERRSQRIPRVANAPQTNFTYGTQAPVFSHRPVGGFQPSPFEAAPAPPLSPLPPTEEPLGGSADDLPF